MSAITHASIPAASFLHRQKFHNAKKSKNESITDWYNRLSSMSIPCKFGIAASVFVLDKLTFSLEEKYQKRLSEEMGDLTLEHLFDIVKQMELNKFQHSFATHCKSSERMEKSDILCNADDIKFENHSDDDCDSNFHVPTDNWCSSSMPEVKGSISQTSSESADTDSNKSSAKKSKQEKTKNSVKTAGHRSRKRDFIQTEEDALKTKRKYKQRKCKPHPDIEFSDDGRTFICRFCRSEWKNKGNLIRHILSHKNEREFICQFCGKAFFTNSDLRGHLLKHSGEKPYVCDICSKRFIYLDKLKVHMNYHAGIKPYPCEICGKYFSQRGHVRTHMRVHTGERPYKCQICDKAFTMANVLATHMNIHSKTCFS